MVDYREIIEGSRYATIFDRMDSGNGLIAAAQSFVAKAHEDLRELDTKELSQLEQDNAIEPMVGTPITMVMSNIAAMEDVEDVVVEMPDYDRHNETLSDELNTFLKQLGIYDSIKLKMSQDLKEHLLTNWIEEGMSNTEQFALRNEINKLVEKLGSTPEFENYVGHCIMATLSALAKEQLEDMGGFEDLGAEDPKPIKDVTADFEQEDPEKWKDSMREYKSMSWMDMMRK